MLQKISLLLMTLTSIACSQAPKATAPQYTIDWVTRYEKIFNEHLSHLKDQPDLTYLEIGVFEGRSLIWMLENILTHKSSRAIGVDLFIGPTYEITKKNLRATGLMSKTTLLKGYSDEILKGLPKSTKLDLIYIDGSHLAKDVILDGFLSFQFLKEGGILIFDDYKLGTWEDPMSWHAEGGLTPRLAVNTFITAHADSLDILHKDDLVILKRKPNPCLSRPIESWRAGNVFNLCTVLKNKIYVWSQKTFYDHNWKNPIKIGQREHKVMEPYLNSREPGEVKFTPDPKLLKNKEFLELIQKVGLEI